MNTKGGFKETVLIGLIIALVGGGVLLFISTNLFDDSKITKAENSCSTIFQKASSSSIFNNNNDDLNNAFYNSINNACSSFTAEVSEEQTKKAADFINSCWSMTNGDSDFLPSAYEGGVCMYCGNINLEDYEYERFREDLRDELEIETYNNLFETEEVTSLNSLLMNENSFEMRQDSDKIGVVMYSYKNRFSTMENIQNSGVYVANYMSSTIGGQGLSKEFFDLSVGSFKRTQKGIGFVQYQENGEPLVNGNPMSEEFQCEVIIPQDNIEY